MSSYRDDVQETAVASSSVWLGLASVTEEIARASSALLFGLLVLHADAAQLSDAVIDRPGGIVIEYATISDQVIDARASREVIAERAAASDQALGRLRVLHADGAQIGDQVIERTGSLVVESAVASDAVLAQRRVASEVLESARIADSAPSFASMLVQEVAQAQDFTTGRAHAVDLVVAAAAAADDVIDARQTGAPVTELAHAADAVIDQLHAVDLVRDGAMADDQMVGEPVRAQVWTANTDSWAMSRHDPVPFTALVVIDGALYGLAEDGVFALDTPTAQAAVLRTAPVDVGQGVLVHPLQAFLEYELEEGAASMEVTTTQSGEAQTYAYALQAELAKRLTNGRFIFGRGLRGRHFTFALKLNGKRGHINDLSVSVAPTKRRV
ncbi:hypothetical protein ABL840_26670 [Variovorax sp. NFACC27]|uniref:hypothetical protein n=1 Tax=unclassified Variovorax TaxID=663243 RepID=UPI00089497D1|nr:hypothetical protein SAMN03159371_03715 [Variovorax sp. NFACC28]SEG78270.1 hypothetical protein SAMN03159365_03794 [Variovorax sp. NFACC29]SFC95482.1 hypothetical protein SAMN03159379_03629 [Variovorax sp. NFACC26]SFG08687.1 hypothetical protein SAMN03159447_01737 [Variovorax sp. NFACC27]